jgi:hypothetical protein
MSIWHQCGAEKRAHVLGSGTNEPSLPRRAKFAAETLEHESYRNPKRSQKVGSGLDTPRRMVDSHIPQVCKGECAVPKKACICPRTISTCGPTSLETVQCSCRTCPSYTGTYRRHMVSGPNLPSLVMHESLSWHVGLRQGKFTAQSFLVH